MNDSGCGHVLYAMIYDEVFGLLVERIYSACEVKRELTTKRGFRKKEVVGAGALQYMLHHWFVIRKACVDWKCLFCMLINIYSI